MPSKNKAFEIKQTRFRTNWLKNATRSMGITLTNTLSDVAPNSAEIILTGEIIARTVLTSLRKDKNRIGKVGSQLSDNTYVKIGQTAINNALKSIKTGKWGDGADFGLAMPGESSEDDGFSYGDEDTEGSASSAELSGLANLSDQINKQSIAQIKTAQASMETMVSINASRMYQTQQISSEILGHINNMENHLASIVEFNNSTLLKYVEASMGYYEKTGSAITAGFAKDDEETESDSSNRATNIFKNRKGGIDFKKYKEYLKKNVQKKLDDSGLGIVLDEETLSLLAQDPIGFSAQMVSASLINKFAGTTIKGIEDKLASKIPDLLIKLGDLSESDNPISKFIGDIFGIKASKRDQNFKDIKINKGPIPFDGETKHAITSVITHELRNQTAYLKVLADHALQKDSDDLMKNYREFYNESTGKFERGTDINLGIAKLIEENVLDAFKSSEFGLDMAKFTNGMKDENAKHEVEKTLDDFYMHILRSDKSKLDLPTMLDIVSNLSSPGEAKRIISEKIKLMYDQNRSVYDSAQVANMRAHDAFNDSIKYARENGSTYHLEESDFMGLEGKALDDLLFETLDRARGPRYIGKIDEEITQDPDIFYKAAKAYENGDRSTYVRIINALNGLSEKDYNALIEKANKKIVDTTNATINKVTGGREIGRDTIISDIEAIASGHGVDTERVKDTASRVGDNLSNIAGHVVGGFKTHTGMLGRFLYGDSTKGTKGIFDGIADSFNKGLKSRDPNLVITDGSKAITAGAVGALTGTALSSLGLLPAIFAGTGPIGGALAGLTIAIASSSSTFKKALFGGDVEEFEDGKGNKFTHKKKGLIGKIGTTLEANLINPIKTAALNAITRTALNIEHGFLIPAKYLSMFAAKRIGTTISKTFSFVQKLGNAFTDENSLINKLTRGLFKKGTELVGGTISGGIDLASSVGGSLLNIPGNILGGILSIVDPELAAGFDAERAGFRSKMRAAKKVNKHNKMHDKIGKELAKLTDGQYGEDTEEARAYLRYKNPDDYKKLFGDDGKGGKYGKFAAKDAENKFKAQLAGKAGADITGSPSGYDAQSQTAIYTARMLIMQEQLVRAILGEKVEFSIGKDATLNKGGHDKKSRKEAKKEKGIKYINDLKNKYIAGKDLSEEELERLKRTSIYEEDSENIESARKANKEELEFQEGIKRRRETEQNIYDAHKSGDNGLFTRIGARIRYGFKNSQINRDIERHEAEQLGLRKPKKKANVISSEDLSRLEGVFRPVGGGEGRGRASFTGGRGILDNFDSLSDEEKKYVIKFIVDEQKRKEKETSISINNMLKSIEDSKDNSSETIINPHRTKDNKVNYSEYYTKTVDEIREEKQRKEDEEWKKEVLTAINGVKTETEDHKERWSSIFSKKGLITGALILAAPFLLKVVPKVFSFLKDNGPAIVNTISTIATSLGAGLGSIINMLGNLGHGGNNTNGNTISEQVEMVADRGLANLSPLNHGEVDNTSTAKVNVLANLVRIGKHADDYAKVGKQSVGLFKKLRPIKRFTVANNNANRRIGKIISGIKNAPENISKLASKFTGKNAADVADTAADFAAKYGDDVADSAVDAMAALQREGAEAVAKYSDDAANAASKSGLFKKIKGFIGKFYDNFLTKFTKKFGSSAPSLKAFAKEKLIDFLQKNFGKIGEKLAARISAGTGGAAISLGLSEVAFATLGAINGATGAAKLFHVPSKKVDGTMRAISAVFGGLAGTTVGGVVDLIFQIFYQMTGIDFLNGIATTLYTFVKKLQGKTDDIEKLANSQAELNDEYNEYKNTEIEKSYQTQLKAGLIPEGTSLEEFIAGVQDGTYKAVYDSQADYIAKHHGSLGDKILGGIGKFGKTIIEAGKLANKYVAPVSIEMSYEDSNGNIYTSNTNGNYDITSPEGEKIGEIAKNMLPKDAVRKTKVSTAANNWLKLGTRFLENHKFKSALGQKAADVTLTAINKTKEKTAEFWDNVKNYGINFSKKKLLEKNIIYRPIDNPLSYYRLDSSGKAFDWYNQNDEIIEESAKTYDEMLSLYSNGLVTKDVSSESAKKTISTSKKSFLSTIGSTIGNIWDSGVNGITTALDKIGIHLGNKEKELSSGDTTVNTESEGGSGKSSESYWSKITDMASDFFTKSSNYMLTGGSGGRGTMYSQNDARWKNASYGSDTTMGDSGCGPTAMAMALSDVTGKRYDPMQMAGFAEATGNRDQTGTNWNFINTAANAAGVSSTQVLGPSASYIGDQLASGNELILSGRTGGYGGRGNGSAYTSAGHYIVGTGIDRNGIVSYKDPTTGGMGRIPLGYLTAETGSAWSLGGRGNIRRRVFGGRGREDIISSDTGTYEENSAYNWKNELNKKKEESSIDWIGSVQKAKKAIAESNAGYTYGGSAKVNVDGKDYIIRNDCSGFVSFALALAGLLKNENTKFTSVTFGDGSFRSSLTLPDFFGRVDVSSMSDLKVGDILCYSGHVEVFAEAPDSGSKPIVYNCGSDASAGKSGVTKSGHTFSQLVAVYRPRYAGSGESLSSVGMSNGIGRSVTINGKTGKAKSSVWDKITGMVSDFFGEATNRFLTTDFSNPGSINTDYSDIFKKYINDEDGEETEEGTEEGGSTIHKSSSGNTHGGSTGTFGENKSLPSGSPATSASANDIYKMLREHNLSPIATAGIMGNWQEESSNNPDRFEADYTNIAKSRGGIEGVFSSNENLNDFTEALLENYKKNGVISDIGKARERYRGSDDNLYPGIGLAQWTGPRGENLINFAKNKGTSWRDYDTQIDFFLNGKNEFNDRNITSALNLATSPSQAAAIFQDKYENGTYHRSQREANANAIYEQFGGAGKGIINSPTINNHNNMSRYNSSKYIDSNYGGFGNAESIDLLKQVVSALTSLVNIESGASNKLDMLGNISPSAPTNNFIAVGNGSNPSTYNLDLGKGSSTAAVSRNSIQAEKIARGGIT